MHVSLAYINVMDKPPPGIYESLAEFKLSDAEFKRNKLVILPLRLVNPCT